MTTYYDPNQNSIYQALMSDDPKAISALMQSQAMAGQMGQSAPGGNQNAFYNQLLTPDAMPTVDAMPSIDSVGSLMGGAGGTGGLSSMLGMGGGGNSGVGNYTSGITAGVLPTSTINQASSRLTRPISPNFSMGSPAAGSLANQLGDYTRAQQSGANVNLQRSGAGTQAGMNMSRQNAQSNAGLGWSNFLAGQNENRQRLTNSFMQPFVGSLLSSLTS